MEDETLKLYIFTVESYLNTTTDEETAQEYSCIFYKVLAYSQEDAMDILNSTKENWRTNDPNSNQTITIEAVNLVRGIFVM